MMIELLLRAVIHPRFRAILLSAFGAKMGRNVRIYEGHFMNLDAGFSNLNVADDVHIAPGYMIDLKDEFFIGKGSTLSPNVTVMTHADPGSAHGSPLCEPFPPLSGPVRIGGGCWIGTGCTLLCNVQIADGVVIGASSLVRENIVETGVYAGVPARHIRPLARTSRVT